eukprot:TRINITY_DN12252_c0_g1::TRINITY_DN12252_c0_g1_i1::g.13049::m.13049 TRINITY_DN12252_c0_g1::TRINITY_DN12252_c0_g1_i1::g.13049  ORF type:complete len:104 (-),score=5.37 TRINITY_DN12252_c0_g1_i1:490-765(-)
MTFIRQSSRVIRTLSLRSTVAARPNLLAAACARPMPSPPMAMASPFCSSPLTSVQTGLQGMSSFGLDLLDEASNDEEAVLNHILAYLGPPV